MTALGAIVTSPYVARNEHRPRELLLMQDIPVGSDPRRIGWTFHMMEVYEHERGLDRGRFENFSPEPQEFAASIRLKDHRQVPWSIQVAGMVNWIAEQVDSGWSVRSDMESMTEGVLRFTFEDGDLAVVFKMVFA